MTIQAIQTEYAGCRFRSRLEARWAVFFDRANIPWEYEPEGFEIDGRAYLPDFRLIQKKWRTTPTYQWVEVKPEMPTGDQLKFLRKASAELHGLLLVGPIPRRYEPDPWRDFAWRELGGQHDTDAWVGFGHYYKNDRLWVTWDFEDEVPETDMFFYDPTEQMGQDIADAYQAARSARFEHGEKP